jgi:hypothetical protein
MDVTPKRKKWPKLAQRIHIADEQPRRRETPKTWRKSRPAPYIFGDESIRRIQAVP